MSFESRFGGIAPAELRTMLEHAYARSFDQGCGVQFDVLADIGEYHRAFPNEPRIEVIAKPTKTEPKIACPNVIPSGWFR